MIQALYEATGGEAIVTSDVGQHQMWAAQYYDFPEPRRWINSGGLGTMGFGLPAAMGAAVGCPDQLVCCIAGDGSVQMNAQELATCAQSEIPIKVFIMNNGYLGMVRQWQELFWDGRYSHVDMGEFPDFVKLAEAYGVTGMRLAGQDDAGRGHARGDRDRRPVLVDVRVTREENTYPMIPAGSRRARDGGVSAAMGEPGTKEPLSLEELEAATNMRTGRKHVLSILVENKSGVLTRIAGLFARRGFNIDTLTVGPTEDEQVSRVTLTVDGALHPIDQVTKQLHKLDQRAEDPRPRAGRHGRARAGAVQGLRRRRAARRADADRRDLPRQGRRRDQARGHHRGHRHDREDRGVRGHGAAVRPDRDDAHGRDRDLAGSQRDLSGCCGDRLHARRSLLDAAPSARAARARAPGARASRARPAPAARRRWRRSPLALPADVDPSAVVCASRRAGEPWFVFEQPDRGRAGARRARAGVALQARGRGALRELAARWRALVGAARCRRPCRRARGRGPVAVGGFAFAPDGGAAPHWAGFAPASLIVPELALHARGRDGRTRACA